MGFEPSPLQVMEVPVEFSWLFMKKPAARNTNLSTLKVGCAALLFTGLCLLSGCAGISTGSNGKQQVAAGSLASNPASLTFGTVTIGKNQTLSAAVTNSGSSSITISQAAITGNGFTLSGITAPIALSAGQSASFSVEFSPTSSGSVSGNVTITSNASNPTVSVSLSGAGTSSVGQLGASPATLGVGNVIVGTSGSASGSLSASGANVTITAANTSNSAFSLGGISLPVTVAAGQSLPYTITFSPQTTGAESAMLTVTSDAATATTTEGLTGTGTAAPTHTVSLSWNPSSSPSVSGYNVYRAVYASSCGSYVKINSLLNTTTAYADSSVADGGSYCYAATAVNTSNEESGFSNIVSNLQIPPA